MKIRTDVVRQLGVVILAGSIGCGQQDSVQREPPLGLDPAFAGAVCSDVRYLARQTVLLERAQSLMNPDTSGRAKLALLDTADPFEDILHCYASLYQVEYIANNQHNDLSAVPPAAFRFQGDVAADLQTIRPVLDALGQAPNGPQPSTPYAGATFLPRDGRPRVSLQRPYYDLVDGRIVDRTLILLVNE